MDRLKELIRKEGKTIKVFLAKKTIDDPEEQNYTLTWLNPIPVKGLISDLSSAKRVWALPGLSTSRGKQIIVHNRHRGLFEGAFKLEIDGDDYYGWNDEHRQEIKKIGNYIRIYAYSE